MGKLPLHQSATETCSSCGFQMFPGPLLNGDRLAESGNARWKQKLRTTAAITGENYHKHESLTGMNFFWVFLVLCDVLSSCRSARLDGGSGWRGGSSIIRGSDRLSVKPICQLVPSSHLTVASRPSLIPANPRTPRPSQRSVVILQVPAYLLLLTDRYGTLL